MNLHGVTQAEFRTKMYQLGFSILASREFE